jgi:hypothetical protein
VRFFVTSLFPRSALVTVTHQNGRRKRCQLPDITTGRQLTWDEWVKAVEDLEARAELAERRGLHSTAKSWRDMIANLRLRRDEA